MILAVEVLKENEIREEEFEWVFACETCAKRSHSADLGYNVLALGEGDSFLGLFISNLV